MKPRHGWLRGTGAAAVVLVIAAAVSRGAQAVTIRPAGDALIVTAPGIRFIHGDAETRLKDGRAVRFDLRIAALERPDGPEVADAAGTCDLSYDLWEERFAVTHLGARRTSVSHLTAAQAEAWCLERIPLPLSDLLRRGRDTPFWIRIAYVAGEPVRPRASGGETATGLRALIELFSRRPATDQPAGRIDAGPFRLAD